MQNKYKVLSLILIFFILLMGYGFSRIGWHNVYYCTYYSFIKKIIKPEKHKSVLYRNIYVSSYNGKYTVVNKNNKKLINGSYDSVYRASDYIVTRIKNKYKLYDCTLNYLYTLESENRPVMLTKKGTFIVSKHGRNFVVDGKNKVIFKEDYDELSPLRNTSFLIIKNNNKYGLYNIFSDKYTIPVKYEQIEYKPEVYKSYNTLFWVKKDNKWALIGPDEKIYFDFIFDEIPARITDDNIILTVKSGNIDNPEIQRQLFEDGIKKDYLKIQKREERQYSQAKHVEGDLHMVYCYGSSKDKWNVNVTVKNKPITLYLHSYNAVNWRVNINPGVNLKKIYYSGYYQGNVEFADKSVPVEYIGKRAYLSDLNIDRIKEVLDKYPITVQSKNLNDTLTVDGITGKIKKEYPKHSSTKEKVRFVCDMKECNISADGLKVGYANTRNSSFYKADKYYSNGKYYFEAEFKTENTFNEYSLKHNNIGIISPKKEFLCIFYSDQRDDCLHYEIPVLDDIKLKNGDIIGYAVDFDNGYVYIAVNGNWLIGSPEKNKSIYKMNKEYERDYTVMASAGKDTSWKFNFGASPFKYKIPKGFKAYDDYSSN